MGIKLDDLPRQIRAQAQDLWLLAQQEAAIHQPLHRARNRGGHHPAHPEPLHGSQGGAFGYGLPLAYQQPPRDALHADPQRLGQVNGQ